MQRRHTRQKQIIQNIIAGPGKHMTAEERKAVIAVKQAVNKQPLGKRIKYAMRIILARW